MGGMDLCTCRNCLSVYGTAQTECPLCGADESGHGAEVEFDGEARSAVARLGGLYAAILPAPESSFVLWCARGVCRFDETVGLAWSADVPGRVDDVSLSDDTVRVVTGGLSLLFGLDDGEPRD